MCSSITGSSSVMTEEGGMWVVEFEVDDFDGSFDEAISKLTSAGFTEAGSLGSDDVKMRMFESGDTQVYIAGSPEKQGIAYNVTQQGAG